MDRSFWLNKWDKNEIAFHESEANPLLIRHLGKLDLPQDNRLFLPLCGKTRDLAWLLASGYRVAGAELSELAIEALFEDLGMRPEIVSVGKLSLFRARNIDIFAGDIFDLTAELLGPVDAVYDRAALVALPHRMRVQYTSHLMKITGNAPQLLITCEYMQQLLDGPPFSIVAEELQTHYAATYRLEPVESREIAGGLKGKVAATETAWLLQNRSQTGRSFT
jgi:thiopurine S-methyltransferase